MANYNKNKPQCKICKHLNVRIMEIHSAKEGLEINILCEF